MQYLQNCEMENDSTLCAFGGYYNYTEKVTIEQIFRKSIQVMLGFSAPLCRLLQSINKRHTAG